MNLLFDLDGTLTDPYQGITRCISHAMSALGKSAPPQTDLRWCIGPPLKQSFATLLDSDDDKLITEAVTIYRERFGTIGMFENEVYDDIPEVLEGLREMGHALYVATSKPTVYAKRIVEHFDLLRYFESVHGSELDGTRCDKTSLLAHVLQSEGISASSTIMVGDRGQDMVGAKTNGIYSVGVLWGYGTQDELESSGADVCIGHPEDLVTVVSEISE